MYKIIYELIEIFYTQHMIRSTLRIFPCEFGKHSKIEWTITLLKSITWRESPQPFYYIT